MEEGAAGRDESVVTVFAERLPAAQQICAIAARPGQERVNAGHLSDDVRSITCVEEVVAFSTFALIVAILAHDAVIAGGADGRVIARAGINGVVAGVAIDQVCPAGPINLVAALAAEDGVVGGGGGDAIVARPAVDVRAVVHGVERA